MGQHLLYNRETTFLGNSLLKQAAPLRQIASASLSLGFTNSITVDMGHALEHEQAMESLLSDHYFHSICFIITPECIRQSQYSALHLLEKIADYPIILGIIGDIRTLIDQKLMSSNILNREDLFWSPMTFSGDLKPSCTATPVRACHSRLQLYVDKFGDFYPCTGLMGLEPFRLGSISEPFEQTLFADPKVMTEIQTWAEQGPDVEGTAQPQSGVSELGPMCDWHLAHITRPNSQSI